MAPSNILIQKLDEFIRKYYKNQLIRGGIYFAGLFLVFFLTITVTEYFAYFNVSVRTAIFYLFLLCNAFILWRLIAIPLLKLNKIGAIITYSEAATIIGAHFPHIKDKLLNTLQLQDQSSGGSFEHIALLEASINQRITDLRPVAFTTVINLGENRKYAKYAILPLLILTVILFTAPSVIKESALRLLEHRTYFTKPAPFTFLLKNKALRVGQHEDYELEMVTNGKEMPNECYIELDGYQYKMNKAESGSFKYLLKNLQHTLGFRFFADGFYSNEFKLTVVTKPVISAFEVQLQYPSYLNKPTEILNNVGDLSVPIGTKAVWKFNTQYTDLLTLKLDESLLKSIDSDAGVFGFASVLMHDGTLSITPANTLSGTENPIQFAITVTPDAYPSIEVDQKRDSISEKLYFFSGLVKDDYGFSHLSFNYQIIPQNPKEGSVSRGKRVTIPIGISKSITQQSFFYSWDMASGNVKPGDRVEYYFEVSDNDGIHGPKTTKSQVMSVKMASVKELDQNLSKANENLKSDLKTAMKDAKQLQKDLADLSKKLLEKKTLTWEDKKKVEQLLEKQKDLQKNVEQIQQQNQQNLNKESEFKQVDKEIAEKQQQLADLMKQVMSEEMKKVVDELQKMLEKADKQQVQDKLEQMKDANKDLEKELERSLELFKQMELEKKLDEAIGKLDNLAEKQQKLAEKTEQKGDSKNNTPEKETQQKDLQNKQEQLGKEFDELSKEMKDLEKKDQNMQEPNNLKNPEKEEQDIQQDQQESEQSLQNSKNSKASKSQKSASKKMEELSKKMKDIQKQMGSEELEEDINALRALLENLLKLSFNQEQLISDLNTTAINNPQYLKISQRQKKLKDDAKMIEDSLFALSKRRVEIRSIVNKEIGAINSNIEKAVAALEARDLSQAGGRQQYSMTAINNLALLLNEALNQMQKEEQESQQKGEGSCKKPSQKKKGSSMSAGQLKKMQEKLNKQLQEMKEGMKPGEKPGRKNSEQLAKMAAEQEYIRQQLQKLNQQENKDGKGSLGNLEKMQKQMEETTHDIYNKNISTELLKRQQEILTRLLEAEKAEREREQDEKRESKEPKSFENRNPSAFDEYKRLKQKEFELLRSVPPSLNEFYKKKSMDYFENIGKKTL